jgi:aminopeptidase N
MYTLGAVIALLTLPSLLFAQALYHGGESQRNRTYDVHHYRVQVAFEEQERRVIGTTLITFSPLVARLDSVVFDAVGMSIGGITAGDGRVLRYDNRSPELAVFLGRSYQPDDTVTLSVSYTCTPSKGLYFIQPDSSNPRSRRQIWTQGEDMDNRHWFPCYDFPDDKATSEVIATVREEYTVLSNGELVTERHDPELRTRTFHWRQKKPHVSYLIMMAAGEYAIVHDTTSGVPLMYYMYPHHVPFVDLTFGRTGPILKFLEEELAYPYPWEKYAQIIIQDFMYGGMENTSAVTLNEIYVINERAALDFTADDVVAHELAHQWWGNLVTSRDWTHLWLNEGFANYYEALYKRNALGEDEFQHAMMQSARNVRSAEERHGRKPMVSVGSHTTNLYDKGAWVLHMLRRVLGDEVFRTAMREFLNTHAFMSADTRDLQRSVENTTGRNLDWFFKQWIYGGGYPKLDVTWKWEESEVVLRIRQQQTEDSLAGTFRFPLDIGITTDLRTGVYPVWVDQREQVVRIPAPTRPRMVVVDKGQHLLKDLQFEKTKEEYLYQLEHADDIAERIAAARGLRPFDDREVYRALRSAALGDPFWVVRQEAVLSLSLLDDDDLENDLMAAARDIRSGVRTAAVGALGHFRSGRVEQFLEDLAESDSSYLVVSACIRMLTEMKSDRAFDVAVRNVGIESHRDILRRASLQAFSALRDVRAVPHALRYAEAGNASDIRVLGIRLAGELGMEDAISVRRILEPMIHDRRESIRSAVADALASLGDSRSLAVLEERMVVEEQEGVRRSLARAISSLKRE